MSNAVLKGNASGTGTVTIESPNTNTDRTITLPDATGTLVLAGTTPSFNGIAFPATQSASTDANTLDDYEEGTWTPTIDYVGGTTGSPTYTSQLGRYVKIGKLVSVNVYLSFNKNTLSGGYLAYINGLPFTSSSTATIFANSMCGWYNPSGTAFINMQAIITTSKTRLEIYRMTAANVDSAPLSPSVAEMGTSITLYITATYYTD